jgi:Glycosyl hydrolases family 43
MVSLGVERRRLCRGPVWSTAVGPYTYLKSFRPNGQVSRDMTLFQDEDGTAYQICASEDHQVTHIDKLTDDYLGTSGKYIWAFRWTSEAPAIFKRNGKYYYIGSGCSGWAPNAAVSAVADSMNGPWKALGNPCRGTPEQNRKTFGSQSTYVLPVAGKPDALIFMADRCRPGNAIDGRYVWLPIQFENDKPVFKWMPEWDLSFFDSSSATN